MKLINRTPLIEGSLFSGYDGIGLALKEMGLVTETAWYCDPDPGAAALLAHHHPDVPNLGDIMRVGLDIPDDEWKAMIKQAAEFVSYVLPEPDWSGVPPVDILTGGFPCQDISNAGKRVGITGARSALWKYYVRAIRALRPRLIFVENVAVLRTRGLEVVLADLAELGFDAEWVTLTASAVGAPHVRNRMFLVAQNTQCEPRDERGLTAPGQAERGRSRTDPGGRGRMAVADADSIELREQSGWSGGANGPSAAIAGWSDETALDWREFEAGVRRWEGILGRFAPEPTVPGVRRSHVLSPHLTEWMMGLPEGWITGVPGLTRNQQIKLAGNGVVPQQAAYAFVHLLERLAH